MLRGMRLGKDDSSVGVGDIGVGGGGGDGGYV